MSNKTDPGWDYFKLLLWFLFLSECALFSMVLIFGRVVGYGATARVCFYIGLIVAVVFLLLFALNLLSIILWRLYTRIRARLFPKK